MIVSLVSLSDTYWEASVCPLVTTHSLFSSIMGPLWCSRSFGTRDGDYQGTIIICRSIDSPLTYVHVKPAQPKPSSAPILPCETHPAQRPPVGNPT